MMRISATCWIVLLGIGPLLAAQPPAPSPSPSPVGSTAVGPALDDGSLPPPRRAPQPIPSGPIVEEPAPTPHEQPAGSGPLQQPPQFHEEAAPMPRDKMQPPARFWMPNAARDPSLPDVASLHRDIERMRLEREAMLIEDIDLVACKSLRSAKNTEANLRLRVAELLIKVAQQSRRVEGGEWRGEGKDNPSPSIPHSPPSAPSSASPKPQSSQTPPTSGGNVENGGKGVGGKDHLPPSTLHPPPPTPTTVTDAPIDPLALAQSLFRARDYAAALNAYRKLDKEDQNPEDRIIIQYMTACCLRKLEKMDEASVLYREAANSPGNDFLMENAQWYLRTMKDRRELEGQLAELRQRRQTMKSRKP